MAKAGELDWSELVKSNVAETNDKLKKTVPKKTQTNSSVYDLDINNPDTRYSGSDLRRMQVSAIEDAKRHVPNNVKTMVNSETGKNEHHLLVHWGIGNHDENQKNPNNINDFALKDGKVHLTSSNGGVVSQDAMYSGLDFASRNSVSGKSRLFSFWVPMSKIHADYQHTGGPNSWINRVTPGELAGIKRDANLKMLTYINTHRVHNKDPFMNLYPNKLKGISDLSIHHKFQSSDMQHPDAYAADFGHTHILPGSFQPATLKEMNAHLDGLERPDGWNRAEDSDRDKIAELHKDTFPHMYMKKSIDGLSKMWPEWTDDDMHKVFNNTRMQLQATDQQIFGHLVVDEEHIKKTEQEYENKLNKWYEAATQRITKDEDTAWASGKSFNESLTEQERLKRNMHLGDGE